MFFQSITCCRRENVKVMADRIKLMRQKIYEKLKSLGTPGSWEHLVQQIGMFGYTGLNGMLLLCVRMTLTVTKIPCIESIVSIKQSLCVTQA